MLKSALKICFTIVRLSYLKAPDSVLSILSPTTKLEFYYQKSNAGRWDIIVLKTLYMYIYFTPHSFLHSLEGHLIWNRYWDEVFELSQIRSIKFIFLMTDATTSLIFFFALASTFSSVSGAKHSMNFENTWGSQFVKWILSENLRVVLFVATIEQCDNTTQKPTAKSNKQTPSQSIRAMIKSAKSKTNQPTPIAYKNCK